MNYTLLTILLSSSNNKLDTKIGAAIYIGVMLFWIILGAVILFKNRNASDKLLKVGRNAKRIISTELQNKFEYYQKLNAKEKELFVRRVFTFIEEKKWVGKDGLDISLNQKILISASAVQLTFGIDTYLMPHFSVIHLYPDIYTNRYTGYKHKGDVDVRGKITLSWKYFEKGYSVSDDKINLGLHEMAHALDISALTKTSEYLQLLFERFRTNYKDEYKQFLDNKFTFLRAYGKVNKKEFFAVLIETYFENPQELYKNMPELYMDMCFLLNQDIIHNIHRDFIGAVDKVSSKCKNNITANNTEIIKKTSFNILSTIKLTSVYVSILGFLYLIGLSNDTIIDVIIPFMLVVYLINVGVFYFISKRITLTKNFIVLSNFLGKKHCVDLFNIIAVIYMYGEIEIAFFENSKYKKIKVKTTAKQSDIDSILSYLSKTQVLVKIFTRKNNNRTLLRFTKTLN